MLNISPGTSEPFKTPLDDVQHDVSKNKVHELSDPVPARHRSLYEELLLASEESASTPIKPTLVQPEIKTDPVSGGPETSYIKLHNDSNNNMINSLLNSNPKKTVLPSVPMAETVLPVASQPIISADSSSKSESFEIDWWPLHSSILAYLSGWIVCFKSKTNKYK